MRKNVIIVGADVSLSLHVDNERKDISIPGKGQARRLGYTTSAVEAKYPINFTQSGKRSVLSLHCNGNNS